MRNFGTGATRNSDENKLDYEGFLNPLVLNKFAEYMNTHRKQSDGKLRDSDNWQKGIPIMAYNKSLIRHTMDYWRLTRGGVVINPDNGKESDELDLLCAIIFNAQGLILEKLKEKKE